MVVGLSSVGCLVSAQVDRTHACPLVPVWWEFVFYRQRQACRAQRPLQLLWLPYVRWANPGWDIAGVQPILPVAARECYDLAWGRCARTSGGSNCGEIDAVVG